MVRHGVTQQSIEHRFSGLNGFDPPLIDLGRRQAEAAAEELAMIERIAAAEAPAHVVTRVRPASADFMVGLTALLSVDTYLRPHPLPAAVEVQATILGDGRVGLILDGVRLGEGAMCTLLAPLLEPGQRRQPPAVLDIQIQQHQADVAMCRQHGLGGGGGSVDGGRRGGRAAKRK